MKRILTDEQEICLCRDYEQGMKPLELTLKYGMAQNTIWYILKRHNINTHRYKRRSQK